ncbi:glycoside hydrolase family 5 protein [Caulobacter mirabilis]|uniref:Endoglucanase n=1 Tax=Caulobacter mirabilis TaxID=69666 RepID=A0A2D2AWL6_9CAUL|nr:cellulase family glycosylhydrolase [Caulobacter mirabilis]ATQ42414.1 endoglucanase [Caulobacter mirabilis]
MSKLLIDVRGENFVDPLGRQVILRGVNLGGDCKVPYPDGGTENPTDFSDHRTVSFVGRPFPLEDADLHLSRLTGWGFNVLRLLVTWEAVEHAGPSQYDEAYLDYIAEVARKAGEHGLVLFVDFHQDVWSRMSGGDGAPGWIFEAVGLDMTKFHAADAVHVMQHKYDYGREERRQEDRYPMMSWASNYRLPVNGIMWTAFFAGSLLTPDWKVGGKNVQDFLQDHYIGAVTALAKRVKHLPNVVGFDSLNEPGLGWVGEKLSQHHTAPTVDNPTPLRPGPSWTPLEALKAARGLPTTVPVLGWGEDRNSLIVKSETLANADGVSIWLDDGPDPFERAGAWRLENGEAVVVDEDFFKVHAGKRLDHEDDLMQPFYAKVAAAIRAVRSDWILFAELSPYVFGTGRGFPEPMPERTVNASHWYDINILRFKRFDTGADLSALKAKYMQQLGYLRMLGGRINGGSPTLIGEFGIPYDLNEGQAYDQWAAGERDEGVWNAHATALGLMYDVLDALQLNSTQWNYTASNRNDLRVGDSWNQEDLSIYSIDQRTSNDPMSGGRAVAGFSRPYAQRTQGRIEQMRFDAGKRLFTLQYEADPSIDGPTEIFVPVAQLTTTLSVTLSDPAARWEHAPNEQLVRVWAGAAGSTTVTLSAG